MTPRVPLLVAVVVGCVGAAAPEKNSTEDYYPTKIGSTWHYKVGEQRAVMKVTSHQRRGDLTVLKVETSLAGSTDVLATEEIAHTPEGIVRISYNNEVGKTPVLLLKAGAKKGDTWVVKTEIAGSEIDGKFTAGEEKIQLGDTEYQCITSSGVFQVPEQIVGFKYWFHKGTGIVKLTMTSGDRVTVLELEKFEPGK